MRKKFLLAGVFLLFCFFQTMAQQRTITGTVISADGHPLPNATVLVVGQKTGVSTDAEGKFSIKVPESAKQLQISFVGSEPKKVDITSTSEVTVSLESSAKALTDVVIVGYGTVKKTDLTGSVATLTTKDFNKGVIATPEQLLQGRTPGVSVTPASGEPGGAATINIRGSSSIRGNQEPLYVVDGVPLTTGGTTSTQSGVEGTSTPRNPLSFLNPNDIASITVLKDASSEAIYGSRGANGVIIITTKKGKSSRGDLTFNAGVSVAKIANRYDLLNPQDFLVAVKKANIDAGTSPEDAAAAVKNIKKGIVPIGKIRYFKQVSVKIITLVGVFPVNQRIFV